MGKLNLERTSQAIEKYDTISDAFDNMDLTSMPAEEVKRQLLIVEEYARLVGVAYGCDTADQNKMDTCERFIRPGPKEPQHPDDLSFVRKMVRDFQA